ncbi:hypothetical protein HPB47_002428 [Ixodes persulcatus]|uniref:Uncharacterized protein n=1 Tax=Ixodes persulcatus TaxID=34615 RepID=A0AC60PLN8_IXOPE|nr:hypothetical protein HPB47_002428 [Ixodes persulcatus]
MCEERWTRQAFKYVHLRSSQTRWVRRTRQLAQRYDVDGPLLYPTAEQPEQQNIRARVSESETRRWAEAARRKPALALYAREKQEVRKLNFMDNSQGSAMLAAARGGMLRTRVLQAKYSDTDVGCTMCAQGADETAEHIILECTGLEPEAQCGVELAVALGFRESDERADEPPPVEITKKSYQSSRPAARRVNLGESCSNSSGLSKWQYALLFGTPVAAGLAFWYYKRTRDRKKKPSDSGSGKSAKSEDRTLSHNSRSATDVENPYEKAKAFKNQGNKYFKGGKFDKAIECYTEAINICPKEHVSELATFFQNRAAAFDNLPDIGGTYVYNLCERASMRVVDITAVCILEGFQNQNSLMVTDRVLKKLGKASAKEIVKTRKPTMPSKHFIRNYFVSFCEDPIIEATQAFRQGKAPQPEDSEEQKRWVYGRDGHCLEVCLAREEYEKVVAHCNAEVDGGGKCAAEALLLRGTFHLLQGRSQATLDDLNQLLSMDNISSKVGEQHVHPSRRTARVHFECNGVSELNFLRVSYPSARCATEERLLWLPQVLMLLDRLEDTLQDMERTCALRPDFPSAAAQRCYVQYRCGMRATDPEQRQKALDGFAEVQQRFPNCPESYFLHAQLLTETQEFDKAEEYFRKAEKADPTDPNVYVHLGILQLQWKQDFDKAVQYLQKAIDMDEKCQFAYETFGSIQVQRGFLKEGLELFEKAIALAQTETELAHLLSLRDAAEAQGLVAQRLGIVVGPGLS